MASTGGAKLNGKVVRLAPTTVMARTEAMIAVTSAVKSQVSPRAYTSDYVEILKKISSLSNVLQEMTIEPTFENFCEIPGEAARIHH